MDAQPGIFVGGPQDGAIYPIPIVPPFNRPPDVILLPLTPAGPDKMVEYMMGVRALGQEDRLYRYNLRQSKESVLPELEYVGVVHLYEYGLMKAKILGPIGLMPETDPEDQPRTSPCFDVWGRKGES